MARKRQAPATVSVSPKKPRVMHCKSCDGNPPVTVCGCRKKSRKTIQPMVVTTTLPGPPPNIDNTTNNLANLLQLGPSPNSGTLSNVYGSPSVTEKSLPSHGATTLPEVPIGGFATPSVPANCNPVIDPFLEIDGALPPACAADLAPPTNIATPPARAVPSTDGTSPTAGVKATLVLPGDGPITSIVDGNKDEGTSVDAPPLYTISQQDNVPLSTQPEDSDSDGDNRPRASARNPIYGKIDGCYKGNDEYVFHRTTPLRPVMMDRRESTARYRREIQDIALRAERLSCETGCWLFLAARHPNGGQRMVHYSSPKLRRQGLQEVNEIANQFNRLLTMMNDARNDNGMDLQRDRDAAISEKQAADAKVEEMVLAMENLQNEAKILRAQLGKDNLTADME